nr:unknown [Ipomoea trifida]
MKFETTFPELRRRYCSFPDVAEEEAHGAGAERVGLGLAAVLLVGGAEAPDERVEAPPGLAERAGARRRRVRHSEEGAVVVVNLSLPELVEVAQKLQHVRAAAERQRQRRPVVPQAGCFAEMTYCKSYQELERAKILETKTFSCTFQLLLFISADICATSSELASRRIPRIFFSSSFYHRRQSIGIMMFDVSARYHGPDDVSNYAKQLCEVDGWIVEANQDTKLEILNMTKYKKQVVQ